MYAKYYLLLWAAFMALALTQLSHERVLTGTVTDASNNLPLPGVAVSLKGARTGTTTNASGQYQLTIPVTNMAKLQFQSVGYTRQEVVVSTDSVINVALHPDPKALSEVVVGYEQTTKQRSVSTQSYLQRPSPTGAAPREFIVTSAPPADAEEYKPLTEDGFREVQQQPVATFSADVDRAAYSNVRRMLNLGQLPNKDAVRIEEMVNYFEYTYPQPTGNDPVSITTDLAQSPFNPGFQLVRIGLQARSIPNNQLPPANLVFLIDVSGSMNDANKLPLVKTALAMLVDQLRPTDHVAIVTYAGNAGLVLPSTAGSNMQRIHDAIANLDAGGSTAGGAGIQLAYKVARQQFQPKGNNRVILATDGDFNVGVADDGALQRLIEQERTSGVFLSVLGFGMGNYKDNRLETLADKGNGNYAYIDNAQEARKVFGKEFGGTLYTVAKDVKLQVEFNPHKVRAYRLIGYENRRLNNEDFHDDTKDAGELGAGHTVTALYEIIPAGMSSAYLPKTDPLNYQSGHPTANSTSDEWLTLKIRYKQPDESSSRLLTHPVAGQPTPLVQATTDFRFAAAVAGFGLLLRESAYTGITTYATITDLARQSTGSDPDGYRHELVRLMGVAQSLKPVGVARGK